MEVLNKNQRNSARWRSAALLGILLVLLVMTTYALFQNFRGSGDQTIIELKETLATEQANVQRLEHEGDSLKREIEQLKASPSNDKALEILERDKADLKDEVETLERELEKIDDRLDQCRRICPDC